MREKDRVRAEEWGGARCAKKIVGRVEWEGLRGSRERSLAVASSIDAESFRVVMERPGPESSEESVHVSKQRLKCVERLTLTIATSSCFFRDPMGRGDSEEEVEGSRVTAKPGRMTVRETDPWNFSFVGGEGTSGEVSSEVLLPREEEEGRGEGEEEEEEEEGAAAEEEEDMEGSD